MKAAIMFTVVAVLMSGCLYSERGYISGSVDLNGTAKSGSLLNYTIDVGQSFNASNWTTVGITLTNGTQQILEGVLAVWNTSLVDEGNYTLRLSVTDTGNVTSRDYLYVTVENVLLSYPYNNSDVSIGTPLIINGSVGGASFQNYALLWGRGENPTTWSSEGITLTANGTSIVDKGVLGTWNTSAAGTTGFYTLNLVVNYTTNMTKERKSTVILNNYLPGWPKTTDNALYSTPALADLDGDGDLEMIAGSYDGRLYVWHHNGSNYIEEINGTVGNYTLESEHPYNNSFDRTWTITMPGYSSIAVHFERLEAEPSWDYVYILNGSNQTVESFSGAHNNTWSKSVSGDTIGVRLESDYYVTGWGFKVDMVLNGTVSKPWPKSMNNTVYSSPAVGDVSGDGIPDIAVGTYKALHLYHANGSTVSGWPQPTEGYVDSSPLMADINGDGVLEIIVGSSTLMYAFHSNGSSVSGWPASTSGTVLSSAASGDSDGDGSNEIMAGDDSNRVYVWHSNGSLAEGWPYVASGIIRSSPAVGDVDLDGSLEIIAASYDGRVYAFERNGSIIPGWPYSTGAYVYSSPALADLDGDSMLEIVAASTDDRVYVLYNNGSMFGETVNGTLANLSLNSSHNYNNSVNLTWNITVPGYSSIAVHFSRIEVESGYDHIYVLNSSDGIINDYSGTYTDLWSSPVPGDTVKVRLVSDSSVTGWGFSIDQVVNGSVTRPFPVDTGGSIYSSPSIGDINGDGQQEITVGGANRLHAWLSNGSAVPGFPKVTNGSSYSSPVMADFDADGDVDLVLGSLDYRIYVWDESAPYNNSLVEWGMFRNDLRRSGYYPVESPIISLSAPAANVTSYSDTMAFSYTPRGLLNLSNCSLYGNSSGAWSVLNASSNVTWASMNTLYYSFTSNGTVLWSVGCYNTIGRFSLSGENRTLNVALIPTVISNVSYSNVTNASAAISWSTSVPADGIVEYGLNSSYGSAAVNSTNSTYPTVYLSGLSPGTRYHFRVNSTSVYNVSSLSGDYNLTTALTHVQVVNFTANQSTLVNASQLNTTLEFTANSSLSDVAVTVSSTVHNPTSADFSVLGLGKYLEIEAPAAAGSASSIMLRTYYTDDEISSSYMNESSLGFYWYNTSVGEWQRLNSSVGWMSSWVYGTGVNASLDYVWANLSHLSTYAVGGSTTIQSHLIPLVYEWNMMSFPLQYAIVA
ncbi:MAG: FG-GAP-like repeat-containing protein [Candidatus Altiarchaeota archaeon]